MSSHLGQEIFNRWTRSFSQVEFVGLNSAAKALALAELIVKFNQRVAVVCANAEAASRMHQDIKAFVALLGGEELTNQIDYFPGWEHSPYKAFNPSLKNRIRRLRTLHRALNAANRAIVTDIEAFAQRCPTIEQIQNRGFTLRVQDVVSRDELVAKLEQAGYVRNDPVEDPGSYTVRGSIFDIFSSASKRPVRIDFFDDMVETIRSYDPNSQRSDQASLGEATIIPTSELALTNEEIAVGKTNIKNLCDEFGIPKQARDELFEKLDLGIREPSLEYLLPLFSDAERPFLLEHLRGDWKLAIDDSFGAESSYDELTTRLKADFKRAVAEGKVVAPWERLYVTPESFNLGEKASLLLESISVGVPEATVPQEDQESTSLSRRLEVKLYSNADISPQENRKASFEPLVEKAKLWQDKGFARVCIASTKSQAERVSFLLNQKDIPCRVVSQIDWTERLVFQICEGSVSSGFRIPSQELVVVTDAEIFGPKKLRSHSTQGATQPEVSMGSFVSSLEDLNADELIVHSKHGIGRYRGLMKLEIDRVPQDFLLIEYAGADKLYLPVYRLDQAQRYVGAQEGVSLDKLGTNQFEKTKQKVKAALQDLAHQLLQLYAKRASREGFSFSARDEDYSEFEARFPYAETPDQLKAIEDVSRDMETDRIMDRLICGDVGYGKTEVAMRAAFRAVVDGKQVVVLVPTTVLALQHERSFRERFKTAPLPVNIGVLSRFKTPKEVKETLTGLKQGSVDIVIGTHRLLSKDVAFKDLGLIVIDEEQRFGVEHKEKLKALRVNTDVLTLTATPIPRTLQLSLMGIRDISVINTPPVDRLSVRTYIARFNDDVIRSAIQQEIARGGQVFFIHNRVQSINAMADRIQAIVPEAKIIIAHGQLDEKTLEERMLEFYNKKGNVLICSTIIESGLDIPSANTMIINRADMFGLSQLYQLRGRVGRSQVRAYCYLLLPEEGAITEEAKKRLEVIQRFVDLGSGFKIASHDLELRGGGDILGKSQSGHIAAVGFELYAELLDETIRELRGQAIEDHFDPEIKLPVPALLPESYVPDVHQRLGFYKKLSQASSAEILHALELELQDRYGRTPTEVQNLIWLIRIKQILRLHHIKALIAGPERTSIDAGQEAKLSPVKMLTLTQREPQTYLLTPDSKVILKRPFQSAQQLFHDLEKLLTQVAEH
ncbi:MAG: transcription-repair coupling factor [Bdellovibrionota bacterium]